jgi:hypothetical protein
MLSKLKSDLRYAFSRQSLVQTGVFFGLSYVVGPVITVYVGLSWPYLIPVGAGLFVLLISLGIWRRRRSLEELAQSPAEAVLPFQDLGDEASVEYDKILMQSGFRGQFLKARGKSSATVKDAKFLTYQQTWPADPPTRHDDPNALADKIERLADEIKTLVEPVLQSRQGALEDQREQMTQESKRVEQAYYPDIFLRVVDACERALANGYWYEHLNAVWREKEIADRPFSLSLLADRLRLFAEQIREGVKFRERP